MNLGLIKTAVLKSTGRAMLHVRKLSPEILMTVGVVGIVTGVVLACKATLKVEEVLDEAKEAIEVIPEAEKKDLVVAYVQTGIKLIKLYGPSVLITTASIGCILGSHGILKRRNFALVAAYKAIEKSFGDYRTRVISDLGVEQDRLWKNGIVQSETTIVETDEKGKTTKSKKIVENADPNDISQYARFFDEASINWSKTPEYNLMFLKCQQNYMNDLLQVRGHVFLNEVYDVLGVPRSQAGAIVGWVKDEEMGDGFIDFGIFDGESQAARSFVNGNERSILLDFNVDGVVYDMI